MTTNIYVIDTSSLIDLKPYPADIFNTLWQNLGTLAKKGRIISTTEVLEELKKKDDEITNWAKSNNSIFKTLNPSHLAKVREILTNFPELVDPDSENPQADPFIIALALCPEVQQRLVQTIKVVVSQERSKKGGRPKIPDVCAHYKIVCINLFELFRQENWKF